MVTGYLGETLPNYWAWDWSLRCAEGDTVFAPLRPRQTGHPGGLQTYCATGGMSHTQHRAPNRAEVQKSPTIPTNPQGMLTYLPELPQLSGLWRSTREVLQQSTQIHSKHQ
eukprot:5180691-Amphidinium_carterae.1